MESSENKVIPFQSNRIALNQVNKSIQKKDILENNQGNDNVENANQSQNPSGTKSFFASKKELFFYQ